MNGVHDMGGMTDFGPIVRERNEPAFHAGWERRVRGLVNEIAGKRYNWDEFRFAIERLDPVVYLSTSYYERWLAALERYLLEKGDISPGEMRDALHGWVSEPGTPLPVRDCVRLSIAADSAGPLFKPGDAVVARTINPAGHTRLPWYVRGKRGTVDRLLGKFIFPDRNASGLEFGLQPVYAVRFAARELWGDGAGERDGVCVDLWENYLLPG